MPGMPPYPASEIPFLCLVGTGVASFWRGAWYAMDAALYPDDVNKACAASLTIGFGGFAALHTALQNVKLAHPVARGTAVYMAGLANIFAWHGVWLVWDIATETGIAAPALPPPPPTKKEAKLQYTRTGAVVGGSVETSEDAMRKRTLYSGLMSHFSGLAILVGVAHLSSALAPPARIGVLSDYLLHGAKPAKYLTGMSMFQNKKF